MTKHLPARREDDEALGPCMKALRSERQRQFVRELFKLPPGAGQYAAAARAAGYGEDSSAIVVANIAHNLLANPAIVAAINEEVKLRIRAEGAAAVRVVQDIMKDTAHKDRLKAAKMVLERIDPEVTKVDVTVEHKIDPVRETLAYLKHLREIGTPQEILIKEFGKSGLEYYDGLLAKEQVIDAEFTEVKPADEFSPESF